MKYAVLVTALFAGASPALAQVPEKTYTLTVSQSDLGVIAQGLGEVASKLANPVISKLNQQIQAQDAPPKPDDKPKP